MYTTTTGLILRENTYKESSRILTVLTAARGKLTMNARGAKRRGSRLMGASQHLAFCEMTIFSERGKNTLTEARPLELFEGLREDLPLYALGTYFAELMETLSHEEVPDPELLSLGLNALYALSERRREPEIVKAAFELRLMCLAGFEPSLDFCVKCGKEPETAAFSPTGGVISCESCREAGEDFKIISRGALDAMRHIVDSEPKRIMSFTVGERTRRELAAVCEDYLLAQLGQGFRSLDYYKGIK